VVNGQAQSFGMVEKRLFFSLNSSIMKSLFQSYSIRGYIGIILLVSCTTSLSAQIPPPGYDREMEMRTAMNNMPRLDRDSISLVDTVVIFNPETYEETVQIIKSKYSLRDYCKTFLGMNNPDILLDGNPHTIVDPQTYEDLTIRLNSTGKLDTIPK
jgi:hypothetical protein